MKDTLTALKKKQIIMTFFLTEFKNTIRGEDSHGKEKIGVNGTVQVLR